MRNGVEQSIVRLLKRVVGWFVAPAFHFLWYHADDTWKANTFLGYSIQQCPLDLQLYQELIYRLKPNFILQTGVSGGGSVLYFASLLDVMGASPAVPVIGIDVFLTEEARRLKHNRIKLFEGDSIDPEVVRKAVQNLDRRGGFVILDSDHSKHHVLAELNLYSSLVSIGSYIVVEDTNINGHPVYHSFGPGPFEAVDAFLELNKNFVRDEDIWKRNKFSFHRGGWLRRIS